MAFFSVYFSLQAAPTETSADNPAAKASVPVDSIVASGISNPTCFDNYQSWPSSNTFNTDAPWSIAFVRPMPGGAAIVNNFERDINGDGLMDYIYSWHSSNAASGMNTTQDCVYLSNGNGWTLAYRCYAAVVNNAPKYYGDCAEVGI